MSSHAQSRHSFASWGAKRFVLFPYITLSFILLFNYTNAFYIPGIPPHDFTPEEKVELTANALTSTKTQLSMSYYSLPFCKFDDGQHPSAVRENIGQIFAGDYIISVPYQLHFQKDINCAVLCKTKPTGDELGKFREAIENEYVINFILDNLPGAVKQMLFAEANTKEESIESSLENIETSYLYERGFYVGNQMNTPDDEVAGHYIYNHVKFIIGYNDRMRIVQFLMEPMSIKHVIESEGTSVEENAKVRTCTNDKMGTNMPLQGVDSLSDLEKGYLLFTYSVEWRKSSIEWSKRWMIYFEASNPDASIHWFHIINSTMVVLSLTGICAMIMIRILRKDIADYNAQDIESDREESGWKLIHANVFRAPKRPLLLSITVGTGVELYCVVIMALLLSVCGILSPSLRGALVTAIFTAYVLAGFVAGYISSRLYKMIDGTMWKLNALLTALCYPGFFLFIFFIVNAFMWSERSTNAIPFSSIVLVLTLWLCLNLPLSLCGSFLGQRAPRISTPCQTDKLARRIPERHWWQNSALTCILTGMLPFGAVLIEYYFILSAIWLHHFYYLYGFLLLVTFLLTLTCIEVSIVAVYFHLAAEDYRWWWCAFFSTGSSGLYFFAYAIVFFSTQLSIPYFISTFYYFVYMATVSIIFAIVTGSLGLLSALQFNRIIYGAIKVD